MLIVDEGHQDGREAVKQQDGVGAQHRPGGARRLAGRLGEASCGRRAWAGGLGGGCVDRNGGRDRRGGGRSRRPDEQANHDGGAADGQGVAQEKQARRRVEQEAGDQRPHREANVVAPVQERESLLAAFRRRQVGHQGVEYRPGAGQGGQPQGDQVRREAVEAEHGAGAED